MRNYIRTAVKYTKNIATTGAIAETSKYVVDEVSRYVSPDKKQIIVEFGAGHGNITRGILAKMNPESKLYAFEINAEFCEELRAIGDPRLVVVCDSAEAIDKYILENDSVDTIISTIPFSFIPDEVLDQIISKSYTLLKKGSRMMQALYSGRGLKYYKKHFDHCSSKLVLNFPLASVYTCQKA